MVRRSRLVSFYFKEKFCVSACVGKSILRDVYPCLTLSKKLYRRLYFIQIVHSYGKMLFLAPNNYASLTSRKSCVFRHAFSSRLLGPCLLVSKKSYLSVVFAAEDGIEACIPGSI